MTSPATRVVDEVMAAWQVAEEAGDAEQLRPLLHPDVELISPLTARLRFRGVDQVTEILSCAFRSLSEIHLHTLLVDGDTCARFLTARCGAQTWEEAELVRFRDGAIIEITVFGRPLPAAATFMSRIGPLMARRQGRPILAGVVRAATAPLAAALRFGDRTIVPRGAPRPSDR